MSATEARVRPRAGLDPRQHRHHIIGSANLDNADPRHDQRGSSAPQSAARLRGHRHPRPRCLGLRIPRCGIGSPLTPRAAIGVWENSAGQKVSIQPTPSGNIPAPQAGVPPMGGLDPRQPRSPCAGNWTTWDSRHRCPACRLSIPESRSHPDSRIGSMDTGIPGSESPGASCRAPAKPRLDSADPDRQPGHQPPHSRVVPGRGLAVRLAALYPAARFLVPAARQPDPLVERKLPTREFPPLDDDGQECPQSRVPM